MCRVKDVEKGVWSAGLVCDFGKLAINPLAIKDTKASRNEISTV